MKSEEEKGQLIYDDACPLCRAYTKAFVQYDLLKPNQRSSFSNLQPEVLTCIDVNRARHEIPYVNTSTGITLYGMDALLAILEKKTPKLVHICKKPIIYKILQQLYHFISYNRRVITATRQAVGAFDCSPDFNYLYRILFLCIGILFNTAMLYIVQSAFMQESIFRNVSMPQLQMAHLALVGCNLLCAAMLQRKNAIEYLGQINMLALMTILLLLPFCIIYQFIPSDMTIWSNVWMGFVFLFIIFEYRRRMRYTGVIQHHKFVILVNCITVATFIAFLLFA